SRACCWGREGCIATSPRRKPGEVNQPPAQAGEVTPGLRRGLVLTETTLAIRAGASTISNNMECCRSRYTNGGAQVDPTLRKGVLHVQGFPPRPHRYLRSRHRREGRAPRLR